MEIYTHFDEWISPFYVAIGANSWKVKIFLFMIPLRFECGNFWCEHVATTATTATTTAEQLFYIRDQKK